MNWKRISIFVLILYLVTAGASFPFGFIGGFLSARQAPVPNWVPLGGILASVLAAAAVFYLLAKRQHKRPWIHAFMVAAFAWLVSFPLDVLLLGQPVAIWARSIVFALISLSAGVSLASSLRNGRKEGDRASA